MKKITFLFAALAMAASTAQAQETKVTVMTSKGVNITSTDQITDGGYYLLYNVGRAGALYENPSTYRIEKGGNPAAVTYDDRTYVWQAHTETGGTFSFSAPSGKYMSTPLDANDVFTVDASDASKDMFTITAHPEDASKWRIQSSNNSEIYWDAQPERFVGWQGSGTNSQYEIIPIEVEERQVVNYTYSCTDGSDVYETKSFTGVVGEAFADAGYPAYVETYKYGITGNVTAEHDGQTITVLCYPASSFPFTAGETMAFTLRDGACWLKGTDDAANGYQTLTGTGLSVDNYDSELDAFTWIVGGDWYYGITLQNQKNGRYLSVSETANDASSNLVTMIDAVTDAAKFEVVLDNNNYYFRLKGSSNQYLSNYGGFSNGSADKPLYTWNSGWNIGDPGSVFTVMAIEESAVVDLWKNLLTEGIGGVGNYPTSALSDLQAVASAAEARAFKAGNSVIALEDGKYYRIVNEARKTGGTPDMIGVKSDGTETQGQAGNNSNVDFLWQFVATGEGTFKVKRANAEQYWDKLYSELYPETFQNQKLVDSESAVSFSITELTPGFVQLKDSENQIMHEAGGKHMCAWDSGRGSASSWKIVPATDLEVAMHTVDDAAYTTVYLPFAVQATDATAYRVSAQGSTTLTANAVAAVPAQKGVIIKGSQDQATATLSLVDSADDFETLLSGSLVATSSLPAGTIYTLAAEEGIGFYKFTGTTLAANKAYWLNGSGSEAAGMQLVFGGVTAIEALPAADGAEAPLFDLSGRRVVKARKGGLYIRNGRKFIVK